MNFFDFSSVNCLLVTYLYPLSSMSGLATIDKHGRWSVMSVIRIWELCIEVFLRSLVQWFCNKWLEGT